MVFLSIGLCKEGVLKYYQIHRLVLKIFFRFPKADEVPKHIDGDKKKNQLKNLKLVRAKTKKTKAYKSKLTATKVKGIKTILKINEMKQVDIATKYNISESSICNIKKGRV